MIIDLGGGVLARASHISLISGVQPVPNRPNTFQIRILFMGGHEHVHIGAHDELLRLHTTLRDSLDPPA